MHIRWILHLPISAQYLLQDLRNETRIYLGSIFLVIFIKL